MSPSADPITPGAWNKPHGHSGNRTQGLRCRDGRLITRPTRWLTLTNQLDPCVTGEVVVTSQHEQICFTNANQVRKFTAAPLCAAYLYKSLHAAYLAKTWPPSVYETHLGFRIGLNACLSPGGRCWVIKGRHGKEK